MRFQIAAKVVVLAVVGIATSWVTQRVLAQRLGPRKAAQVATGDIVPAVSVGVPVRTKALTPPEYRDAISSLAMRGMNVTVLGNVAIVDAEAYIFDKRPGHQYVWAITILDAETKKNIIQGHRYDDRIYSVPETLESIAKIHDEFRIEAPPGTYWVEAALYDVDPLTGGLEALNKPARAETLKAAFKQKKVMILGE